MSRFDPDAGHGLHYRLTIRWYRVLGATVFALFFLLETTAYSDKNGTQPGEIAFTSVFLAVIAWLTVRAGRCATLLATDDKVTIRRLVRTRSWRWDEVDEFVVDTKVVGVFDRRVLGIRKRDGTIRWFTELGCRPARGARRSQVDDAAAELNHYISRRQAAVETQ